MRRSLWKRTLNVYGDERAFRANKESERIRNELKDESSLVLEMHK